MAELEPITPSYLPKRIRACPQCHKSAQIQVIIWGLPDLPVRLSPTEEGRVLFGGSMMPVYEDPEQKPPKWYCPACDVSYTGTGQVVPEP